MIAPIEAGERLARITDVALAAGSMNQQDATRVSSRLERLAGGEHRKPMKASPAALAAMGIAVIGTPEISQGAENDG